MDLRSHHDPDSLPLVVAQKATTRLLTRGFRDFQTYLDSVRDQIVLRDDLSPSEFRDTLQVCSLFSKYPYPVQGDEYSDWKALQASIQNINSHFENFVHQCAGWLSVLDDMDVKDYYDRPQVGPGAVYERIGHIDRVRDRMHSRSWESLAHCKFENRHVEVPKTWKRNRLIFVEESDRMLLQQSVRSHLEDAVRATWIGRYYIVDSQERNRRLIAKPGFSSIDLSAASDWISVGQVYRLFHKAPVLRSHLMRLRSRRSRHNDAPTRSYGTMGNALTFPVMSILFCCVLRLAEDELRQKGVQVERGSVFGDDIVCDQRIFGTVLGLLTRLGYSPNARKSFVGFSFKESCGMDVYKDENVTPLRIKKEPSHDHETKTAFDSYSNRSHIAGNWHLAKYLSQYGTNTIVHHRADYGLFTFTRGKIILLSGGKWTWSSRYQAYVPRKRHGLKPSSLDTEDTLQYQLLHGSRLTTD